MYDVAVVIAVRGLKGTISGVFSCRSCALKVESQGESFFSDLLNATYWFEDAFALNMEAAGIVQLSRAERFIIVNITAGETRATNIARNLGVSRQALSQVLRVLEEKQIVIAVPDPGDLRARVLKFTDSFAAHASVCSRIVGDIVSVLEGRLGKDRVRRMKDAISCDWGTPPLIAGEMPEPVRPIKLAERKKAKRMERSE